MAENSFKTPKKQKQHILYVPRKFTNVQKNTRRYGNSAKTQSNVSSVKTKTSSSSLNDEAP